MKYSDYYCILYLITFECNVMEWNPIEILLGVGRKR